MALASQVQGDGRPFHAVQLLHSRFVPKLHQLDLTNVRGSKPWIDDGSKTTIPFSG